MLRITTTVEPAATLLKLEGRLVGDWVMELRRCYEAAAAPREMIQIDLTDVGFVDRRGRELLREMVLAGTKLIADEPMMQAIITEILHSIPLEQSNA